MTSTNAARDADLLLVDDDEELRRDMAAYFTRLGYRVDHCSNVAEALEAMRGKSYDAAIVDMVMPGGGGIELLERLKSAGAECPIVMLTGKGTVESAVEAMKLGAADFLAKPARLRDVQAVVERVLESSRLRKENAQLRAALERQEAPVEILGASAGIQEVLRLIARVGPTDKAVLIQGESGTGKELVARALHHAGPSSGRPMVVINCAALPESLLESELFGYEKGAFTGAAAAKPGLFEAADGGTLFIDEVGELAGPLQAKLLRVLEDGSLRRVGSIKQRRVRVRLLAATHRDLAEEVRAGRFREDLYYRINVLTIALPPLRERAGDVRLLALHFAGPDWRIDEDAMAALERYDWPGNVRQLRNAVERAKILADDDRIALENLPPEVVGRAGGSRASFFSLGDVDLDRLTRQHVAETYKRHGGNKARTARALGVSRRALYRLIQKYRIEVPENSSRNV
jgi:DNA-binding NtrC family response regulator